MLTIKLAGAAVVVVAVTLGAQGQSPQPPQPQPQPPLPIPVAPAPEKTKVVGCLKTGTTAGTLELAAVNGDTTINYRVVPAEGVNVAALAGRRVEVSGTVQPEGKKETRTETQTETRARSSRSTTRQTKRTVEVRTQELRQITVSEVRDLGVACK